MTDKVDRELADLDDDDQEEAPIDILAYLRALVDELAMRGLVDPDAIERRARELTDAGDAGTEL